MIHENIKIDIDYEKLGIKHKGADAVFTTYIKEMYPDYQNVFERPLVIICPGGGYEHHSPREGEAVALKMLDFGYNAVVLRYSLMPDEFPCALYEAAYTINYVRNHAKEWDINPDKIIIAGFSAGGHVAASLATMYDQPELADFIQNVLHVSPKEVRPDGLLLGYPVITSGPKAHRKSFERLLGDRYDELVKSVSLEERVSSKLRQPLSKRLRQYKNPRKGAQQQCPARQQHRRLFRHKKQGYGNPGHGENKPYCHPAKQPLYREVLKLHFASPPVH